MTGLTATSPTAARDAIKEHYAPGDDRPLGSYAGLIGLYTGYVAAWAALLRRRGLPERVEARDIALVSLATYKASRLITRDKITSPIRAPFTRLEGDAEASEVSERPVGTGPRRALGELLTCPFCSSQWIATTLVGGMLVAPRATRAATAVFASLTGSDAVQWSMSLLRSRASG